MGTVYVIHDVQDRAFVEHVLLRPLPSLGLDSWVSADHLERGDGRTLSPARAMTSSDAIIAVISNASVASPLVREEVDLAVMSGRPLVPVRIDGASVSLLGESLSARAMIDLNRTVGAQQAEQLRAGLAELLPAALAPAPGGEALEEARPEDYRDRKGYDAAFLGADLEVVLPIVTRNQSDVLAFNVDGSEETVLRYRHFSVVMSKRRRQCLFSAVNIDGRRSKKKKRVGWRIDPRIPREAQIRDECYGDPPRFARGHMTRREDPVWGTDNSALVGNSDSMHVTNAVPQMQPFNAGIWLGLEDYALDNAREDDMRISVFTGPFLAQNDPVRFGVRIPVRFWKVIAFIHDETDELCATGYTMSQRNFLREEEFVFGQHETSQASIASIEQGVGLSFGSLTAVDPFDEVEEALPTPLTDFAQIRFTKRR